MAEKVTIMVIKVDLQCPRCYKKIKKVLCKIPQVRNQVFDEKQNTVIITVISCCPERIKQKICCKGGDTIKGIEIKEPEKTKETEKKKEQEKHKQLESNKHDQKSKKDSVCCRECYEGQTGGPCYHGWGRPAPAPPCWEWYGRPVYDSWGCGGGNRVVCYVNRCYYFCEENPSACTIM